MIAGVAPGQICQLSPSTPQRLTEQYVPESTAPQETTASLGKSKAAVVHQWGIVRVNSPDEFEFALPDFVHTIATEANQPKALLEFSALYVHPPMMLKTPLDMDVRATIHDGVIDAWYPYAPHVGNADRRIPDSFSSQIIWKHVLAGVQADSLKTTNSIWMIPRSVEAPATLKVYKPGPVGTQPDDPGTTEGEVFLFLRGQISSNAIQMEQSGSSASLRLNVNPLSARATLPPTTAPLHGWVIDPVSGAGQDAVYRLQGIPGESTMSNIPLSLPDDQTPEISAEILAARFNEAFAGSGLDGDEADALTRMLLELVGEKSVAIVILPQRWVDATFPLEISGSATESPVRVFVGVYEMPIGTKSANTTNP